MIVLNKVLLDLEVGFKRYTFTTKVFVFLLLSDLQRYDNVGFAERSGEVSEISTSATFCSSQCVLAVYSPAVIFRVKIDYGRNEITLSLLFDSETILHFTLIAIEDE